MFRLKMIAIGALCLVATTAEAKVISIGSGGFIVTHEFSVAAPPKAAEKRFLAVGSWWSDAHSFSGKAANLKITAKPGGCWCEKLPDGGFVKHMELTHLMPGSMLVFQGGLGPVGFLGAAGVLTVTFAADGEGSKVSLSYSVGGFDAEGFAKLAPAVDAVLGEQVARYAASLGGAAAP